MIIMVAIMKTMIILIIMVMHEVHWCYSTGGKDNIASFFHFNSL